MNRDDFLSKICLLNSLLTQRFFGISRQHLHKPTNCCKCSIFGDIEVINSENVAASRMWLGCGPAVSMKDKFNVTLLSVQWYYSIAARASPIGSNLNMTYLWRWLTTENTHFWLSTCVTVTFPNSLLNARTEFESVVDLWQTEWLDWFSKFWYNKTGQILCSKPSSWEFRIWNWRIWRTSLVVDSHQLCTW